MKVIVSGGGSGGHVYPAIAIATEIKSKVPDADILFIGANGKLEMDKVPQAGFKIEGLNIMGLQRKLTARNLKFPFMLIGSMIKARKLIKSFQPDVAVGVGGFASGPALYMASALNVPTLVQEQNSYPGITNKLLANRVKRICVAYDGMDRFFPQDKIVLTGNPVRRDLQNLQEKREEACAYFGLDPRKQTIFLFGGSLGAKTLNNSMQEATKLLSERDDIQVLWQMGKLYADAFKSSATARLENVNARTFIDRMDLAYACADLIVCRAGAMTISELCVVGRPAILVPSPNVAEDHQTMNAQALVKSEAVELVLDSEAAVKVIPTALELLDDPERRSEMASGMASLGKPNAVASICDEILKLVQ